MALTVLQIFLLIIIILSAGAGVITLRWEAAAITFILGVAFLVLGLAAYALIDYFGSRL